MDWPISLTESFMSAAAWRSMTRSSSGLPISRLIRVSVTPLTVLTISWTCLARASETVRS